MAKADLIDAIRDRADQPLTKKATGELVDALFGVVGDAIRENGRFSYPGFGTFTVKDRAARTGRNPRTGQSIQIDASRTVGFKPAPGLKEDL